MALRAIEIDYPAGDTHWIKPAKIPPHDKNFGFYAVYSPVDRRVVTTVVRRGLLRLSNARGYSMQNSEPASQEDIFLQAGEDVVEVEIPDTSRDRNDGCTVFIGPGESLVIRDGLVIRAQEFADRRHRANRCLYGSASSSHL